MATNPQRRAANCPVAELVDCDAATIRRDVLSQVRPVVLRGLVRHWPATRHGLTSPQAILGYLRRLDNGSLVNAILMPHEARGRLGYNAAMSGFNFVRNRVTVSSVGEQILRYAAAARAPAVAAQAARIDECLPGFVDENPLPLLDSSVRPRLWLGNAVTTPAHVDETHNIACVVSGRRRFTLFPPEQIGNLYIGPVDFTPTGAPIALPSLTEPDFERFPRLQVALEHAQTAELEPGDALYIPALWWHQVESLSSCNVLVNYWWHPIAGEAVGASPVFDCLLHCMLTLRRMPSEVRAGWRAAFEHYIFGPDAPLSDHIPPERRGVLGEITPELAQQIRDQLLARVKR
ncbi:MAG: cupin-like domain-containing protein [Steroidobacteraceae bacterium]